MLKLESVVKFENSIRMLEESFHEINQDYDKLSKELSKCDLELNDLQHYIEFADINDAQAIKITFEMKALLNNRRNIKNQMEMIRRLKKSIQDKNLQFEKANEVSNDITKISNKINEKIYKPRIRVDLFENLKVEHVSQVNI